MSKAGFYHIIIFCILICLAVNAGAAPFKYWVLLKNKNGTPYSLNQPNQFLTQKSIDRRTKYNIPYHVSDLPVNNSYVSLIDAVNNVKVLYVSKWLNGVVISIDNATDTATAMAAIKSFSFVATNNKVNRYKVNVPQPTQEDLNFLERTLATTTANCGYDYGGFAAQARQLNLQCLHEKGYNGSGMTIAVMDVGFTGGDISTVFDSLRADGRILGTRDFVDGGTNAYKGGSHGFNVLSCMASLRRGTAVGTAPKASYWLFRTEEGAAETISEEYNWIRAAEFADSVGVDMITTSLGYTTFDVPAQDHTYANLNGRTAPMSIAANLAARKGIFVLNAAGNEGSSTWHFISVPADADSICTVGAVNINSAYAYFSSVGPTSDGRIKPDLVACGEGAWICDASGNCYGGANGTSFATPILAGAVACYWQSHRDDNNIKVLNDLKKLATNASSPNNTIGWGIPKFVCPPTPTCNVSASFNYTIAKDGLVKFTSTSAGTASNTLFKWHYGDGITTQTGSTSTYFYSKTGVYSASLTVTTPSYSLESPCIYTLCESVSGSQSITIKLDFEVNPYFDPNTSILKLNLNNKLSFEYVKVEVFDMLGRILFSSDINNASDTYDLNAQIVSSGTYIVKVNTSRGSRIKKIIKF